MKHLQLSLCSTANYINNLALNNNKPFTTRLLLVSVTSFYLNFFLFVPPFLDHLQAYHNHKYLLWTGHCIWQLFELRKDWVVWALLWANSIKWPSEKPEDNWMPTGKVSIWTTDRGTQGEKHLEVQKSINCSMLDSDNHTLIQ